MTQEFPLRTAVAALVALAVSAAGALAEGAGSPVDGYRPDPTLMRLFTPLAAPPDTYAVIRVDQDITRLAAAFAAVDPDRTPDKWTLARADPVTAFGVDGPYDHARLVELYNGQRPHVVRAFLKTADGTTGYTLVAPYPDPSFTRFERGTLVIVVRASALAHGTDERPPQDVR